MVETKYSAPLEKLAGNMLLPELTQAPDLAGA